MPDTLVFDPEYSPLHYFLFCFKNNLHPFLCIKFSHVPSPFLRSFPVPLPNVYTFYLENTTGYRTRFICRRGVVNCPFPLFDIKSLQTQPDRREVLAKYTNFAFATQSSQMNKCQPFACFHTCNQLSSDAVSKPNPGCKILKVHNC